MGSASKIWYSPSRSPATEHRLARRAGHGLRHRWHLEALALPFVVLVALLPLPLNPIYPGIGALLTGSFASLLRCPDLWRNSLIGGLVFQALYIVFLLGLKWLWQRCIEAPWHPPALLPWRPARLLIEELLFGFGMYWSSVYEFVAWRRLDRLHARSPSA